ncbi:hypothetical protein SCHPADRAFT_904165 [Schizopora paradoxa]|uniref:Uncharacterized protein n=1 Tax=Schizopora paradoxa TaxID=27342 RepID=A0A0H2RNC8_9AGAM|nr:hypothetical protein SCHPADRAFT_904165 [Schizopora paradoxa]
MRYGDGILPTALTSITVLSSHVRSVLAAPEQQKGDSCAHHMRIAFEQSVIKVGGSEITHCILQVSMSLKLFS